MQTFLPMPSLEESARCLDSKRLNKQLVECQQILKALTDPQAKGWVNHPVTRMWKGHEAALVAYAKACAEEWKRRGFRSHRSFDRIQEMPQVGAETLPSWFGNDWFHASHRANLLRKDADFYGQFGWAEVPAEGYPYDRALELMT